MSVFVQELPNVELFYCWKRASAINCGRNAASGVWMAWRRSAWFRKNMIDFNCVFPLIQCTHTERKRERPPHTKRNKTKEWSIEKFGQHLIFPRVCVCIVWVLQIVCRLNCLLVKFNARFRMQMKTKNRNKTRLGSIKTVELCNCHVCCLLYVSVWIFSNNRGKRKI